MKTFLIPNEEIKYEKDNLSARFKKRINDKEIIDNVEHELVDKAIYVINKCPRCDSENTFHKRMQDRKNIVGNVWKTETIKTDTKRVYIKKDFCYDCQKEFIIEFFVWRILKDE